MKKITDEIRKKINQAVRGLVSGASPFAEAGLRCFADDETEVTANTLLWDWENSDLMDMEALRDLKEVEDKDGRVELDLYVTTGHGWHRELETNVYISIDEHGNVGASLQFPKRQEV